MIRRYIPHTVVFISSMGIMIIELLASRIISKYFGNSLYTWTGIIGIVLGGITLGNFLGGKLADRYPAGKAAPLLLLSASALTLLLLVLDVLIGFAMDRITFSSTVVMMLSAVTVIFLLFFTPSTALGTISPVMAKFALERSDKIGTTVGGIYASGAAGSIVGTFLSGFLLVPLFGVRTVVFIVAAVIALLSLVLRGPRLVTGAWLAGLAVLFIFAAVLPGEKLFAGSRSRNILYETDSMYSHITVEENEEGIRYLIMDGLVHNQYDTNDIDRLLYKYERIFKAATSYAIDTVFQHEDIRTLTLGGGALTFPSYLERHYPRGTHEVVEIDSRVVDIAFSYFDIPRDTNMVLHVQDARQFARNHRGRAEFHIVYLDVFNSYSIPYHLTTKEFSETIDSLLRPEGILLVNLIDIFSIGKFIGAYTATLEEVFPYTAVYTSADFSPDIRSTFVLVAAKKELPLQALIYKGGEKFTRIGDIDIENLHNKNNSRVLTDDHAPVENLIAPVFIQAIR